MPPLNFNQTGNTWPIKANKADIYTASGKLIFTYKTVPGGFPGAGAQQAPQQGPPMEEDDGPKIE